MNTKEIAEAVNRPERTVQNWVKKSSAKMEQVRAKMEIIFVQILYIGTHHE